MEDAPGQNVCHKGRRQRNENEADGDGFLLRPIKTLPSSDLADIVNSKGGRSRHLRKGMLNPNPCGLPDIIVHEQRRRPNGCHVCNTIA